LVKSSNNNSSSKIAIDTGVGTNRKTNRTTEGGTSAEVGSATDTDTNRTTEAVNTGTELRIGTYIDSTKPSTGTYIGASVNTKTADT